MKSLHKAGRLRVRSVHLNAVACVMLALGWLILGSPAHAQTAPASPSITRPAMAPAPPAGITMQEIQGLSCMALGTLSSLSVYLYSDVLTEALTGTAVNPVLLIPVLATGFAAGCGVGSTMSPGLHWIFNRFR